jgi:LacI family transcriptional regulator
MPVTQEQIAKRLRVSRQLVSFALNGAPGVSDQMRERIRLTAERLGYSLNTNQPARALAARRNKRRVRTGVLALVLPRSFGEPIRRIPFFVPWLDGVEIEAAERDVALYLTSCHPDRPLPRLLREGTVDGIISTDTLDERLIQLRLPIALLGDAQPGCFGLAMADREGSRRVTEHLLELGHRRLAYVGHVTEFGHARERLAGFREALAARGLDCPAARIETTLWQQELAPAAEALRRLRARDRSFTAVVCYNDTHAMGVVRGLEECGLRVPDDVSVTGFDDVSVERAFRPAITSLRFDRLLMGRRAVQWLCEQAARKPGRRETGTETFPVELVVRESTAAPRPQRTGEPA